MRVGERLINSGIFSPHTLLAAGQRGAKAQPFGRFTGEAGAPAIEVSRSPETASSLGIERNKPIV